MKFSCAPCAYSTTRQIDLNRHKQSLKHKEKVQQVVDELALNTVLSQPDTVVQFECTYCGITYSTSGNLTKHMKNCVKKLVDTIVKEKDDAIKEKNDALKEKDHEVKLILNEKDIQLKDIVINSMKKEIELLNKQLENKDKQLDKQTDMVTELLKATYSSSKSPANINNITYITNNFPNAPALAQLPSYDYIRESTSLSLIEALYLNNEKGNLCQFISKFIIDAYAKKNAENQSMWSCDTSRFTYIINELQESGKLKWVTDKQGIKLKKYVVDPLLQYFQDDLDTYINKYSYQSDLHIVYRLKFVADMYDLIKTGVLASDIIKYIAPYFSLIKTDDSEIKQIEAPEPKIKQIEAVKFKQKQVIEPKKKQIEAPKPKSKKKQVAETKKKDLITNKKSNQNSEQSSNDDSVEEFMKDLREIKALQKTQKQQSSYNSSEGSEYNSIQDSVKKNKSGKHIEDQIKNLKLNKINAKKTAKATKATNTTNHNLSID